MASRNLEGPHYVIPIATRESSVLDSQCIFYVSIFFMSEAEIVAKKSFLNLVKPKLNSNHHFPIDLATIGIPIDAVSIA